MRQTLGTLLAFTVIIVTLRTILFPAWQKEGQKQRFEELRTDLYRAVATFEECLVPEEPFSFEGLLSQWLTKGKLVKNASHCLTHLKETTLPPLRRIDTHEADRWTKQLSSEDFNLNIHSPTSLQDFCRALGELQKLADKPPIPCHVSKGPPEQPDPLPASAKRFVRNGQVGATYSENGKTWTYKLMGKHWRMSTFDAIAVESRLPPRWGIRISAEKKESPPLPTVVHLPSETVVGHLPLKATQPRILVGTDSQVALQFQQENKFTIGLFGTKISSTFLNYDPQFVSIARYASGLLASSVMQSLEKHSLVLSRISLLTNQQSQLTLPVTLTQGSSQSCHGENITWLLVYGTAFFSDNDGLTWKTVRRFPRSGGRIFCEGKYALIAFPNGKHTICTPYKRKDPISSDSTLLKHCYSQGHQLPPTENLWIRLEKEKVYYFANFQEMGSALLEDNYRGTPKPVRLFGAVSPELQSRGFLVGGQYIMEQVYRDGSFADAKFSE